MHLTPFQERRSRKSLVLLLLAGFTALLCVLTPTIAHSAAPTPASPAQIASPGVHSLEQQAQQLYEQGRYQATIPLLQQAIQTYQQQGDRIGQAIALSNLTLSYQSLGQWSEANQSIGQALALVTGQSTPESLATQGQVLEVQGSLYLNQGQSEQAVQSWQQATQIYQQIGDRDRATLSQIYQAQALQTLGMYRRAIALLDPLAQLLKPQPDSRTKALLLRTLGDGLRGIGNLPAAVEALQQSSAIAQRLQNPRLVAEANLSLANIALANGRAKLAQNALPEARSQIEQALKAYQVAATSDDRLVRGRALLNHLSLLLDIAADWPAPDPEAELVGIPSSTDFPPQGDALAQQALPLIQQLQALLPQLPPGREAINLQIGLGQRLVQLTREAKSSNLASPTELARLFATAAQQAKTLNDQRGLSFALGNLGQVYEQNQQWSAAQSLTEQALSLAQGASATDIAYRWQWQLGRLLKVQGQQAGAIAAYQEAYKTLQSLRRDLSAVNSEVQFSFRESVEPIYRQLVDLLLQPTENQALEQPRLQQARQVLEALQVAELENFLQAACQETKLQIDRIIDNKDRTAAVIYPIILADRLEVLLKLPGQEALYHYPPQQQSQQETFTTLKALYRDLQDDALEVTAQEESQKVYNWLIRPIENQLQQFGIKTLIFVQDGPLRTIPMAALYDGKQYLVEKYATSLVLGLEVRDPEPLNRRNLKVLGASLTNPPATFAKNYAELPNVNKELDEIGFSGVNSRFIRDQDFTKEAFSQKLKTSAFDVVHLATHGQFGSNRRSTYLLTADGAIYVDELSEVFRSQKQTHPIELLILSACKTATGNDRAVLGIAGTTVRAGARSAIAGLWSLADAPSVAMTKTLYHYLGQPNITRAEALRQAQLALLKNADNQFASPRFWAPYVLVGSWL